MLRARRTLSPLNPSVTWSTIERIVGLTSLPVLVKGVLRADDARAAVDHGAGGVIVSNHGGRQLDGVVPTAIVLEEIAAAVAPALVLVDGGIRTGRDVLRALCLGAHAVLIGRPYLWALAIAGEAGVVEIAGAPAARARERARPHRMPECGRRRPRLGHALARSVGAISAERGGRSGRRADAAKMPPDGPSPNVVSWSTFNLQIARCVTLPPFCTTARSSPVHSSPNT